MKSIHIITAIISYILCIMSYNANSQEVIQEKGAKSQIVFTYDDNGNRITRQTIVLKEVDTLEKENIEEEETLAAELNENNPNKIMNALAGENEVSEIYDETIANSTISIYPNPTKGELLIQVSNLDGSQKNYYALYALNGTTVYNKMNLKANNKLDLSNKPKGTYLLKIYLDSKQSVWKIIKE